MYKKKLSNFAYRNTLKSVFVKGIQKELMNLMKPDAVTTPKNEGEDILHQRVDLTFFYSSNIL